MKFAIQVISRLVRKVFCTKCDHDAGRDNEKCLQVSFSFQVLHSSILFWMDLKVCLLSAVLVERRFCVEIRICNFSKCQQRWWNSWWAKVEEVVKVKEEEEEEEERNNFFCPQLGHRRPPPSFSFESLPPPHLPPPVLQPQLALLAVVLAAATTRLYYYAHPYRLTYTQLSLSLSPFRFSLQLFDTKKKRFPFSSLQLLRTRETCTREPPAILQVRW